MTREEAIERTLPIVNELLPGASPIGAYAIGAICFLGWECCSDVSREFLILARQCNSFETLNEQCSRFARFLAFKASISDQSRTDWLEENLATEDVSVLWREGRVRIQRRGNHKLLGEGPTLREAIVDAMFGEKGAQEAGRG